MTNLSTAQSIIVHAPIDKPIQVLASAGSGKTRVLTARVRHLIENTKKSAVIALTFTNKAADEMLDRLDDLEELESRCWIATIHSVAQRILDQYGNAIGLPSELHIYERDQDRKAVFMHSLRESGVDIDLFFNSSRGESPKDRERIVQNYIAHFSTVKRELLSEEEIKDKYQGDEAFWSVFQAYQAALLDSGGIDFDDILVFAHRILLEQPWCGDIYRSKYKHICVDEAQDLNKAQYEFIKALCGDSIKSLMMVGDPNQMIYGFNGSKNDYLCKMFVDDFSPLRYELNENYRSSRAVINIANRLKSGSQTEAQYALDGICHFEALQDEDAEAQWICDQINVLLKLKKHSDIEGDISLNNMVVIARNRFVFLTLQECLKENGLHYSMKKGDRQSEPLSMLGKVLDLSIRIRLNPKDWVDGKKLCEVLKIEAPDVWGGSNLLQIFANNISDSKIPYPNIQAEMLQAINELDLEQPNVPKLCNIFKKTIEELSTTSLSFESAAELERTLQELLEFRDCWTTF